MSHANQQASGQPFLVPKALALPAMAGSGIDRFLDLIPPTVLGPGLPISLCWGGGWGGGLFLYTPQEPNPSSSRGEEEAQQPLWAWLPQLESCTIHTDQSPWRKVPSLVPSQWASVYTFRCWKP